METTTQRNDQIGLNFRVSSYGFEREAAKVIDAFLHERSIDRSTYQEQIESLNDEVALVQLEVYDARLEEMDIEAALNYATNALRNAVTCVRDPRVSGITAEPAPRKP